MALASVPRILSILGKHDVPASFCVPAVAALLHPDGQRCVVAEGQQWAFMAGLTNSIRPCPMRSSARMFRANL
jgi:hypothetical protein